MPGWQSHTVMCSFSHASRSRSDRCMSPNLDCAYAANDLSTDASTALSRTSAARKWLEDPTFTMRPPPLQALRLGSNANGDLLSCESSCDLGRPGVQVELNKNGTSAIPLNRSDEPFAGGFVARGDAHLKPACSKPHCNTRTDAPCRSSHHRQVALSGIGVHRRWPRVAGKNIREHLRGQATDDPAHRATDPCHIEKHASRTHRSCRPTRTQVAAEIHPPAPPGPNPPRCEQNPPRRRE
eukprot:scaffold3545_cov126-Isochrysis_galbana.AAC.2